MPEFLQKINFCYGKMQQIKIELDAQFSAAKNCHAAYLKSLTKETVTFVIKKKKNKKKGSEAQKSQKKQVSIERE